MPAVRGTAAGPAPGPGVIDFMTRVENPPAPSTAAGARPWAGRAGWGVYAPAAVIGLAFAPSLLLFGNDLWLRPHYRFFPLVVPGAAALGWRYARRLGPVGPGAAGRGAARALAGMAWLLLAVGVAFITPWFAAVGALAAVLGALVALGGWPLARAALPGWAFLWLAIPPPRKFDFLLVTKLQNVVSRLADGWLDALGVFHVMDGNVVEVAGRELLVDQACSGIYSLFTLMIGAVFYALWVRASWVRGALLAAAAVGWVVVGNAARVVLISVLSTRYGVDAASGRRHEALGLAMFALMLGLVVSTDHMATFWLAALGRTWGWVWGRPERHAAPESGRAPLNLLAGARPRGGSRRAATAPPAGAPAPPPAPATAGDPGPGPTVTAGPAGTWLGSRGAALAFGLLVAPQLMMPGVRWKDALLTSDVYPRRFAGLGREAMPEAAGPLRRVGFATEARDWDNSWGEFSRAWTYAGPGRSASLSLDYQFVEWHELTLCYRSRGWEMFSRRVEPAPAGPAGGGPVIVAEFRNLEGQIGFLVFGLYDRLGRPLDPPETVGTAALLRERLASWFRTGDAGGRDGSLLSYQLQVFSVGEAPPGDAERSALLALFAEARGRTGRAAGTAGGVSP